MFSFLTAQTEKNWWKKLVKLSDEFVKRCWGQAFENDRVAKSNDGWFGGDSN